MRQGVKCKLCKISCHNDCQAKAHATIKCQVSSRAESKTPHASVHLSCSLSVLSFD